MRCLLSKCYVTKINTRQLFPLTYFHNLRCNLTSVECFIGDCLQFILSLLRKVTKKWGKYSLLLEGEICLCSFYDEVSVYLTFIVCVCVRACLCVCVCVCYDKYLQATPCLSFCLSVWLSIHPSVRLSACLHV